MKPNLISLPQLLFVIFNSGSLYLNQTLVERMQNTLIYNIHISQGSVATRLRCGDTLIVVLSQIVCRR